MYDAPTTRPRPSDRLRSWWRRHRWQGVLSNEGGKAYGSCRGTHLTPTGLPDAWCYAAATMQPSQLSTLRVLFRPLVFASFVSALPSCGGSTHSQDDGGPPDGGPWSPVCPDSTPSVGSACTTSGTYCEYGDAWWSISCDTVLLCENDHWDVSNPGTTPCLPEPGPNSPECPQNPSMIGGSCSEAGLTCHYGMGASCECGQSPLPDASTTWDCQPAPGCPDSRPRLGAPCQVSGLLCGYQGCANRELCAGGIWQISIGGC